jgi:hypothetical protein
LVCEKTLAGSSRSHAPTAISRKGAKHAKKSNYYLKQKESLQRNPTAIGETRLFKKASMRTQKHKAVISIRKFVRFH